MHGSRRRRRFRMVNQLLRPRDRSRSNVPERVLPPGFLLPLLDQAGNIDDESLNDMWASLLAAAVIDNSYAHPGFVTVLSQLTSIEACLLSESKRFITIDCPSNGEYSNRFRAEIDDWIPNAVDVSHSMFALCDVHLKALQLGHLYQPQTRTYNYRYETPSPPPRWAEFPPPGPPPRECVTVYAASEVRCVTSAFGRLLVKACNGHMPKQSPNKAVNPSGGSDGF
jgi:hypothetical protein